MPFPGIPPNSPQERKIDRCVSRIMDSRGTDKSQAIAICRSALSKSTLKRHQTTSNDIKRHQTTKTQAEAVEFANYRHAGPASTKVCQTCQFGNNQNNDCSFWSFRFKDEYICSEWLPDVPKLRERQAELARAAVGMVEEKTAVGSASAITAHGPGGLFSVPIGSRKKKMKQLTLSRFKQKIIAGKRRPAGDFLSVPDPTKPSTWKLPVKVNGKPDIRLMGAASAALASPGGFRGQKVQLSPVEKRAAVRKLLALYRQVDATPPPNLVKAGGVASKSTFKVYKDSQGRSRWVTISSNAFRDRDGEIVSTKALAQAVAAGDDGGDLGPLRWWHVPGVELGTADFQMLHGRMLIESGTFKNATIAQAVAEKAADLAMSIGFKHPASEPDINGIFNNINIFERSLVPVGREANRFTSLSVKGENSTMASVQEKLNALKAHLGEAAAAEIIQQAETTQKGAIDMGVSFKSTDDPTMSELLDVWAAYKEAEAELYAEQAADHPMEATKADMKKEDDQPSQANRPLTRDEFNAGINRIMAAVAANKSTKEADNGRIDGLQLRIDQLEAETAKAKAELDELNGLQPPAAGGYRASMHSEPVRDGTKEVGEHRERLKALEGMAPGAASMLGVADGFTKGIFNTNSTWTNGG